MLIAILLNTVVLFLGGIIGMSLITSIFVDSMAGDNNDVVLEKLGRLEEEIKKLQGHVGEHNEHGQPPCQQ